MTAIERVVEAATEAGLDIRPNVVKRATVIRAGNGDHVIVDFDSAGRLISAKRHTSSTGHPSFVTMPASGLEERILRWIERHAAPVVVEETPSLFEGAPPVRTMSDGSQHYGPYGDPFEVVESSTEAEDAFAQGGASGLAQLDARRTGDVYTVSNVGSGTAIGPGARADVSRRRPRTPHPFKGQRVPGYPCEVNGCGLSDRHPIHGGYTAGGGLTELAEPPITVVRLDGNGVEINRRGGYVASFMRDEAEAIRDQLVELLGPAPSDVR